MDVGKKTELVGHDFAVGEDYCRANHGKWCSVFSSSDSIVALVFAGRSYPLKSFHILP